MKKKYIIIPALICMVWLAFFNAFSQKPETERGFETEYTDDAYYTNVVLPILPDKMEFAGEEVPLHYHDVREGLMRELSITLYMHSGTMRTLLNSKRYFAMIEPVMEQYGLPDDFKYLCMAESGLDPEALSPAGAGGLWQIMKGTGRDYGLEINAEIDERYHVEKSTAVASRYLKASHDKLGSWTFAAAAYNCGNEGLARRVNKQKTDNYYDTFLPQETLRYVYRILSLKLITENPEQYGYIIDEDDYLPPLDNWREVSVSDRQIDWAQLARDNGTNYKMLRMLNPWLRDYDFNNRLGKTWVVKMPNENFRNTTTADTLPDTKNRKKGNKSERKK